jgi:Glycosyl hydrolase family 47
LILLTGCQSHGGIGKGRLYAILVYNHFLDADLSAAAGNLQEASDSVLLAELGSLSLEFTRLSQVSKDPRYFDAIQRITNEFDRQQESTKLPGMFPVVVDAKNVDFGSDSGYTLGAMADSFYEYLPKVNPTDMRVFLGNLRLTSFHLGAYSSRWSVTTVS